MNLYSIFYIIVKLLQTLYCKFEENIISSFPYKTIHDTKECKTPTNISQTKFAKGKSSISLLQAMSTLS